MDILEAILKRKSIRFFRDEPLDDTDVEFIIRAAMAAPSSLNRRPWRLLTITNRNRLDEIGAIRESWMPLRRASLGIICCADTAGYPPGSESYRIQDCSAATQNMLLCATGMQLGAVWLGVCASADYYTTLKRMLEIPDEFLVESIVAVGKPLHTQVPTSRFEPEKWYREHWPAQE